MKKISMFKILLVVGVIGLMLCPIVQAQKVRITHDLFVDKQLARDAGDTVYVFTDSSPISLTYPRNGSLSEIRGQWPDSIRLVWYKSDDSVSSVRLQWKAKHKNATLYTCVLEDSVYSATAIEATGGKTLAGTDVQNYDNWGVSLLATTTGAVARNALNAATAAKISVTLECWYVKPGSK